MNFKNKVILEVILTDTEFECSDVWGILPLDTNIPLIPAMEILEAAQKLYICSQSEHLHYGFEDLTRLLVPIHNQLSKLGSDPDTEVTHIRFIPPKEWHKQ